MQKEYVRQAFTEEEKNMLFDACLCYADDMTEARKKLRNTPEANEVVEDKIKCLYKLGQGIAEAFIEEDVNGCKDT